MNFAQPIEPELVQHPEEEDEDDKENVADPPVVDKAYSRLNNFICDKICSCSPDH